MSYHPLQRRRPSAVVVLGVLHLVGGTFDLLGAVCAGMGMAMQEAAPFTAQGAAGIADTEEIQMHLRALPGYQAVEYGELAANILFGIILLAAGVGLLNMQPWARALSLTYVPLAICAHLGSFFYALLVVIPGLDTIMHGLAALAPPAATAQVELMGTFTKMIMATGAFIGLLFITYPIAVLVVLTRAPVVAAFRGDDMPPPRLDLAEGRDLEALKPWNRPADVTGPPDPQGADRFRSPED
jgi:hypothetical protein